MNIVVLCGGLSREREVSLCTGSMVVQALLKKQHNAVLVDVIGSYEIDNNNYIGYIETCREREEQVVKVGVEAPDIEQLRAEIKKTGKGVFGKNVLNLCQSADVVFMALHGEDGEDGKIQATFDMLNIKYTGSGYLGSAVAMSKRFSKQIFVTSEIPTPGFINVTAEDFNEEMLNDVKIPCVVKLSASGSSIGVFIVDDRAKLKQTVEDAFKMDGEVVIEEFIEGREFTCGVLGDTALPLVEIIPSDGFYDYEHKYQIGATEEVCPAVLDAETTHQIQEIAVKAHKALEIDIYSRVDFMMDNDKNIYCLEVNTLPGMTPTSLLPQEAQAVGIGYEELCEKIITLSLERFE